MARLNSSGSEAQKSADQTAESLRRQNTTLARSYAILHQRSSQMEAQINELMKENLALKCENVRLKSDASAHDGMSRAQEKLDTVRVLLQEKLVEMTDILTEGLELSRPGSSSRTAAANEISGHVTSTHETSQMPLKKSEELLLQRKKDEQRSRAFSRLSDCIEEEDEELQMHKEADNGVKAKEVQSDVNMATSTPKAKPKPKAKPRAKQKAETKAKADTGESVSKNVSVSVSKSSPEAGSKGDTNRKDSLEQKSKDVTFSDTTQTDGGILLQKQKQKKDRKQAENSPLKLSSQKSSQNDSFTPFSQQPPPKQSQEDPFALSPSSTEPAESTLRKRLAHSVSVEEDAPEPPAKRLPLVAKTLDSNTDNAARLEHRRVSRGKQVSYVLPSLKAKMRRPTAKLADAILEDKEN